MEKNESRTSNLITNNKEFKSKITRRIKLGDKIINSLNKIDFDLEKINSDFTIWNEYNSELIKRSFDNPLNEYKNSYNRAGHSLFGFMLNNEKFGKLELINHINGKIENLKILLEKIDFLTSINSNEKKIPSNKIEKNNVFIVHGHDNEVKEKVARFIERLGFNPIIIQEQIGRNNSIMDQIELHSNVGYGIILYTPCDIGSRNIENVPLKNRARQNVVFEHGLLVGKIGRENICVLKKGEIELPTDWSGIVFKTMDEDWKINIAKEMKGAGYEVDLNLAM